MKQPVAQGAPAPQQPAAPAPQEPATQGPRPAAATPEEDAMLDKAARVALTPLADDSPEVAQAVEQALKASGELPERNLAMMAMPLIEQGDKAVGGIQDPDMMDALASIVIWELVNMAQAAGVKIPEGVDPAEFAEIVLVEFAILWGDAHPERLDDEDRAELAAIKQERAAAGGLPPGQPQQPPGQQTPIAQAVQQQPPQGGGGMLSQAAGV